MRNLTICDIVDGGGCYAVRRASHTYDVLDGKFLTSRQVLRRHYIIDMSLVAKCHNDQ